MTQIGFVAQMIKKNVLYAKVLQSHYPGAWSTESKKKSSERYRNPIFHRFYQGRCPH